MTGQKHSNKKFSELVQLKYHIAYFFVHSFASSSYFFLSVLNILAYSGTNGSSGLGSVRSEQMDNRTEKNKNMSLVWSHQGSHHPITAILQFKDPIITMLTLLVSNYHTNLI